MLRSLFNLLSHITALRLCLDHPVQALGLCRNQSKEMLERVDRIAKQGARANLFGHARRARRQQFLRAVQEAA